jgi:hypothetical protein
VQLDVALAMWQLLLSGERGWEYLEDWMAFLQDKHKGRAISRDTWVQLFEFIRVRLDWRGGGRVWHMCCVVQCMLAVVGGHEWVHGVVGCGTESCAPASTSHMRLGLAQPHACPLSNLQRSPSPTRPLLLVCPPTDPPPHPRCSW